MATKKANMGDIVAKGLAGYLKTKAKQDMNEIDFKSKLLLHQVENKSNFMQKIGQQNQLGAYRKSQMEDYVSKQPGGEDQYSILPGAKGGSTLKERSVKERYNRAMLKPEAERSDMEKNLIKRYPKISGTGQTGTSKRKEEIARNEVVNSLKSGMGWDDEGTYEFTDRQDALDFIIQNYDVDITDPEIQELLTQYKEREPDIKTEKTGGFFGIGGKEKKTMQKYGHTYELQEDNQWHKVK